MFKIDFILFIDICMWSDENPIKDNELGWTISKLKIVLKYISIGNDRYKATSQKAFVGTASRPLYFRNIFNMELTIQGPVVQS